VKIVLYLQIRKFLARFVLHALCCVYCVMYMLFYSIILVISIY